MLLQLVVFVVVLYSDVHTVIVGTGGGSHSCLVVLGMFEFGASGKHTFNELGGELATRHNSSVRAQLICFIDNVGVSEARV